MLDTHARHWVQPMINRTASMFLGWGLTANQVTWIAFIIGVTSGFWIYVEMSLMAIAVLWISGYLGCGRRFHGQTEKAVECMGNFAGYYV